METERHGDKRGEALKLDDRDFVCAYLGEMAANQLAAGPFQPTLQDIQVLAAAAKLFALYPREDQNGAYVLYKDVAALSALALPTTRFNLTPQQVAQLEEFCWGGHTDPEDAMPITIGWLSGHDDGPGWYVWGTEYPEEGSLPLAVELACPTCGAERPHCNLPVACQRPPVEPSSTPPSSIAAPRIADQLLHATEKVRQASAKTEHEDSELHIALGDLYGCVGRAAAALSARSAIAPPAEDDTWKQFVKACETIAELRGPARNWLLLKKVTNDGRDGGNWLPARLLGCNSTSSDLDQAMDELRRRDSATTDGGTDG